MSNLLTIRAGQEIRQREADEWTIYVVLAVLSAEPESFDELAAALRRYLPTDQLLEQCQTVNDIQCAENDGPWVLVDLTGRTVVGGGGFTLPDPHGAYEADEHDQTDGFPMVWLDTPHDWEFQETKPNWQAIAQRAAERAAQQPRLNARQVLFGPSLLGHLAARVIDEAEQFEQADRGRQHDMTNRIHADWLLTPREDLRNKTPRQILLADLDQITRDLEHRAQQWSIQGCAPPPLDPESLAYRWGGFGTTEVVLYLDLVQALLEAAWQRAISQRDVTAAALAQQLAAVRDDWLTTVQAESGGPETPQQLIESERRRMPVTSDGTHLDCDCPICQVQAADNMGPMFMWFDGHHLELHDEFAFSLVESYDEWRQDRMDDDFEPGMGSSDDEEDEEDDEEDEDDSDLDDDESLDSAWQASYVSEGAISPNAPPGTASLAVGFRLAELVGDLKQRTDDDRLIKALNQAYVDFHTAGSAEVRQSAATLLGDRLESITGEYPELVAKSADLQSCIDAVLRLPLHSDR